MNRFLALVLAALISSSALAAGNAASGKQKSQTCAACHGPEGKGNPQLGAPNLIDEVWLHGGSQDAIVETILKGRTNQMPAHKNILSPAKIHLLTAYVYGLSQQGTGSK